MMLLCYDSFHHYQYRKADTLRIHCIPKFLVVPEFEIMPNYKSGCYNRFQQGIVYSSIIGEVYLVTCEEWLICFMNLHSYNLSLSLPR